MLDRELYSLMVLMVLVATAMTGVLLRAVYPPWRVARDRAAKSAAVSATVSLSPEPGERFRPESP